MKVPLKNYGQILTSRPDGREAALTMKATFKPTDDEALELDFEGVLSVGPSWLDEVITALRAEYGKDRVSCLPTKNPSVIESLRVINLQSPHSK